MTSTIYYDNVAEIAFISNTFLNGSGAAADPTTVSCLITDPSGLAVLHTYAGTAPADIVQVSTGKYTLSVPCSPNIAGVEGLWSYEWIGTGAVSDVQPGTWRVFTPSIANFYIGLEELKDRLGITDNTDDFAAQQAIQAAGSWINEYCGQIFYRITETRTFVPHDIWQCDIDPLVSASAVNVDVDGDGTFEQSWTAGTDYQLKLGTDRYNLNSLGVQRPYRKIQVVQSGKWFPFIWPYSHFDRVQVIGTWGWPAVPPAVAQAALTLASQWFKEKDAPFGVAGVSDYGLVRIQSNPWIVEMLRPYIDGARKVGV